MRFPPSLSLVIWIGLSVNLFVVVLICCAHSSPTNTFAPSLTANNNLFCIHWNVLVTDVLYDVLVVTIKTRTRFLCEWDERRQSAHSWHAYINDSVIRNLTVKSKVFWCLRYSSVSHISLLYRLIRSARYNFCSAPVCNLCLAPCSELVLSESLFIISSGKNYFCFHFANLFTNKLITTRKLTRSAWNYKYYWV